MLESPLDSTTAFVVSILYHYHTICALFHGHWLGLFGFGRVELELRIDGGGLGVVAARSQSSQTVSCEPAQKSHYDSVLQLHLKYHLANSFERSKDLVLIPL